MTDERKVSEGTLNALLHGEQTSIAYLMALEIKQSRDEFAQRAPEKWKPLPCAICGEPNTPEHHAAHDQLAQCQGKWVPLEPAPAQIEAGGEAVAWDSHMIGKEIDATVSDIYRAMLAAAPEQKPSDAPICACGDSFTADAQCLNCTQGLRDWMKTYHPAELDAFDQGKR